MKTWLALSFGLLMGQTPQVTPTLPPDADTQDPAALELRDAWEQALEEAEATDAGQPPEGSTVQMPPLDITTADAPLASPTAQVSPAPTGDDLGAPGIGGAGTDTAPASPDASASPPSAAPPQPPATAAQMSRELERLRAQVQSLQTQVEAQQQEATARDALVQQQFSTMQERAQELERLRIENLELLERAATWLVAADAALAAGELDVGDALDEADAALAQALQNATEAGSGEAATLVGATRDFAALALDMAGRRDVYNARWALVDAGLRLREARRVTLDRPDTTSVLTP